MIETSFGSRKVSILVVHPQLVLALDHDLLAKEDMAAVRDSIGELGFIYHD